MDSPQRAPFKRGEILYDKSFVYPANPIPCDKLLLVLNKNHASNDDVIVIPATTNIKNYPFQHGFNENEGVFYFSEKIGFYDPGTILQLNVIQSIAYSKIDEKIGKKEIERLNKSASEQELSMIFNSLKKRKEDISPDTKNKIF